MIVDYHIHTEASPDAQGTMEEYVKKAVEKRIGEIGFSDHIMFREIAGYPYMQLHQMQTYIKNFLALKRCSEIPIKLGAEIDFFPEDAEKIKEFAQKHQFDYVIGAVHFIGNWGIDNPDQKQEYLNRDILQTYKEYFSLVEKLCKLRVFDVVAHVDIIKIFGFKPNSNYSNILVETAQVLAESNVCVEVNTAGLRKPCCEIYPSEQFLRILHSYDVPIVFSSDAHKPEDVGRNFKEALTLAKKVGYTSACVFNQRKRTFIEI